MYKNLSERIYTENVTYKLTNLEIVGNEGNDKINIVLQAKEDRLVVLKQIDPTKTWGL